jgi:hypothetical protein
MAKGYMQCEGVYFDDVFAPVARLDSVRLLVAIAAKLRWKLHHLDVKSTFLNGELARKFMWLNLLSLPKMEKNTRSCVCTRLCMVSAKHLKRGTTTLRSLGFTSSVSVYM